MSAGRVGIIAALSAVGADAANWAVIVAGSSGYDNYRHQADACHAYQIAKKGGIHPDNIIMMAYDDIAHSSENPFPGKIFNKPDPTGPGVDVYEGCMIDYKKNKVNTKTFLNVMTGKGSGKVLKSTAEDHVFVNFVDHGAPGLIAFPNTELHKKQLQAAFQTMHEKKMFKKLVFYLEACESGSMFEGLNVPGVYALSAANAHESSWGTYCPDNGKKSDVVNGKHLNTCLGDLFSVNWMQDDDAQDTTKETLATQFSTVKAKTKKSHVLQWGDETFTSDVVAEYVGSKAALSEERDDSQLEETIIHARQVDLHRRYVAYSAADTSTDRMKAAEALQKELAKQQAVEVVYRKLADLAYPGDEAKQQETRRALEPPDFPECELAAHAAIREHCVSQFDANSGFAMKFHQVVVNICADVKRGLNFDVTGAAASICQGETVVV